VSTLAYVRVSAARPSEKDQRNGIASAYRVERWFKDEELSGSTCIVALPSFIELCNLVRKGDIVIVASIECLGGSAIELFRALQALRARGAGIKVVQGSFDFSSSFGKDLFSMVASVAHLNETVTGSNLRGE
jgi:DNA invertase Pin-like site-specific DNA recombinase